MRSLVNHLLEQHQRGRPIAKICVVWTVRDAMIIEALDTDQSVEESVERRRLPPSSQIDLQSHQAQSPAPTDRAPIAASDYAADDTPLDILQTEIYLTQSRANMADSAAPGSAMSKLRSGRPDLAAVVKRISGMAEAAGGRRVAVLLCGPRGLVDEVRREAEVYSNCDVHAEMFEF
mmetsp:Transcript_6989/g.18123  ORF Transcript_6989/g.18123 Transcript_6989/m.18123 type:complete len:176 (-) Transcript_6989:285-812(-)